jgi:hypothetical protein
VLGRARSPLCAVRGAHGLSAIDSHGRTIWIVDAHGVGKRFFVHADELLTAFVELESAIRGFINSDAKSFALQGVRFLKASPD